MPASAKKKITNRKRTSSKKKSTNRQRKRTNNRKESFLQREVIILVTLGVSVLLLLSCFGIGGYIGGYVSDMLFGIFGAMGYVFPIFLFVGVTYHMNHRGDHVAALKLTASVIAFLLLCSLIQLFAADQTEAEMVGYYSYGISNHISGGWFGGMVCGTLYPALGMMGELIVTIILLIICIVVITEHSVVGDIEKGGRKVADRAKEDAIRRREHAQLVREERERSRELRMDRKVSGVSMEDTRLTPKQDRSDIHELGDAQQRREETVSQSQANEDANHAVPEESVPSAPVSTSVRQESDDSDFPKGKEAFTITGIRMKTAKEQVQDQVREQKQVQEQEQHPEEEQEYSWEKEQILSRKLVSDYESADPFDERNENEEITCPDTAGQDLPKSGTAVEEEPENPGETYLFPPIELLKKGKDPVDNSENELYETAEKLQQTLHNFGVNVKITNVSRGPAVTRYELQPDQGVKVSKIVGLTDDIKLNLAAADIRIEAPIPGKAAVGIEVPNKTNSAVMLRDLLESREFIDHPSKIAFAAGKDIAGQVVVTDIAKMPHLLIAGATGSGKSVCINTIIMSILYKAKPDEVKLIMIDPKVVELSVYNGIPHLYIPVVTDPKKAAGALNWAVAEMMDRYQKFADSGVRDLKGYNEKVEGLKDIESDTKPTKLPEIVIIVDELADLMMVAPGEVEDAICRLAQLARAAGIHLIIATQRPSVNVITGLIKANMPSRIAFSVSSGVDSRTILDMNGAEKLLGKGDMLFYPQGYQKPARVQGAFVSDGEVSAVVSFLAKQQSIVSYNQEIEEKMNAVQESTSAAAGGNGPERDAYFVEAGKFVIEKDKASIGLLQRWFKIGFNRAARIMDQLAEAGVVGEEEGTKPRKILMSMEEFEQYVEERV